MDTPQTRHPDGWVEDGERAVGRPEDATGGVDDVRDTTQGPTPETRRTMRATKDEPGAPAAFQPRADRETRADIGGDQDVEERGGVPVRVRLRRLTSRTKKP